MKKRQTDLRVIPGVGEKTEKDLIRLGYPSLAALKQADPEEMYQRDQQMRGVPIDRCQLYVYRYAVHYAKHHQQNPAVKDLRWWNFKD